MPALNQEHVRWPQQAMLPMPNRPSVHTELRVARQARAVVSRPHRPPGVIHVEIEIHKRNKRIVRPSTTKPHDRIWRLHLRTRQVATLSRPLPAPNNPSPRLLEWASKPIINQWVIGRSVVFATEPHKLLVLQLPSLMI